MQRCLCVSSGAASLAGAASSSRPRALHHVPFSSSSALRRSSCQQQRLTLQRVERQQLQRCAAKKGGGGGGGGASSSSSESVDLDEVALEVEADAEGRMSKALGVLGDTFNTMRTGRANPAILDRVQVEYYGVPTPLKQVAGISVPDASTLMISPYDKSALKDIEKALNEADLGINPNNDGERIRLIIPPMTQDRRKELGKKVSKAGEDAKVAVRNVRKDALKKLDKYDFPKDTKKDLEDGMQKLTDSYVKKVDDLVKAKTDDIMKV